MTCLAAALLAVGCISSPTDPADQQEPTSVEIAPAELQTRGGTSAHFDAIVRDGSGQPLSGTYLEWTTTDPSVAIVDTQGNVWSFSEGTATATASFSGRGKSSPGGNAYGHSKQDAEIEVTEVEPDRPGRVSDLAVVDTTGSSVTLAFTEVDDGTGNPAEYLVRFQIAPLDWATAADVVQGTCTKPVRGDGIGTSLRCSVEGLADATTYGFQLIAIRATDGVYGDLSNATTARTYDVAEPQLSGGGAHPNEPAGLSRLAEHGLSCVPDDGCSAIAGDWSSRINSNLTVVDDASSPTGDGKVARLRFPDGAQDGVSYARFDGWGPLIDANGGYDYEELYVSFWLKIEGSDFENQTVGTKVFYVAYGSTTRNNHSTMFLDNYSGDQAVMTRMTPSYYIYEMQDDGSDAGGGSVRRTPNKSTEQIHAGQWHHVEAYFKINDINPTQDNGEFKMWVDGVQTHHVTGLRWRSDINPKAFYHLQVTPVWGGYSGDVRTRTDYWRVDNFYISGRD